MIEKLKEIIGPRCSAIKMNGEVNEFINIPSKPMMFCEAVNYSFHIPIRLTADNMCCPDNLGNAGLDTKHICFNKKIMGNRNNPEQFNHDPLCIMPDLQGIRHINMGLTQAMEKDCKPDLYIAFIRPASISDLVHKMTQKAIRLSVPSNGLLAVCSNVFTNYYIHQTVCISFGCADSRKYNGVEKDEIVMSIPYLTAIQLINDFTI